MPNILSSNIDEYNPDRDCETPIHSLFGVLMQREKLLSRSFPCSHLWKQVRLLIQEIAYPVFLSYRCSFFQDMELNDEGDWLEWIPREDRYRDRSRLITQKPNNTDLVFLFDCRTVPNNVAVSHKTL